MAERIINKREWLFWLSSVVLLGAFCVCYYVDIGLLIKAWDNQDFSYCYLVPFLFLYLVYTKRQSLKTHEMTSSLSGLLVLCVAGMIHLAGTMGSIVTLNYMAIWVAVIGLALLFVGAKMVKALAFPFVILAFIVPLPPFLNNLLTFKLKLVSSALSVDMMRLAGLAVLREGNILDFGVTQLQVVDACSGLRYVYPLLLTGLVFAYLFHKTWWQRGLIILATIPISIFSNALRVAITGYLTMRVSQDAAQGFFHGFSGWLVFMVSFVLLSVLSWLLRFGRSGVRNPVPVNRQKGNPGSSSFDTKRIRPSYLWTASVLFVAFWGLSNGFASTQAKPIRKTFEAFPTTIGDWQGEKAYLREEILSSLWADDYIQIQFRNSRTRNRLLLFVPYYGYQEPRHTAHSPVSCLIGGGFAPRNRKTIRRNFPMPFGQVNINQMILEKGGGLLLTNYWFQQRGRIIQSEYWNKWYLFQDSLTKRRTDGALVRLEMPLREGQGVEDAQAMLDSFTVELMDVLPEFVPN